MVRGLRKNVLSLYASKTRGVQFMLTPVSTGAGIEHYYNCCLQILCWPFSPYNSPLIIAPTDGSGGVSSLAAGAVIIYTRQNTVDSSNTCDK